MHYPLSDLNKYCNIVLVEMLKRSYNVTSQSIYKLEDYIDFTVDSDEQFSHPFNGWHNERYIIQCFYNLQEKYDNSGISEDEWKIFVNGCCEIAGKEFLP